uniref:Wee1-like protein kinase 2 (Trinotate prediction) n=1 Tax=Henneguya salminicola TaxID=69463 RepID=A0A6G3MEH0_HENSL
MNSDSSFSDVNHSTNGNCQYFDVRKCTEDNLKLMKSPTLNRPGSIFATSKNQTFSVSCSSPLVEDRSPQNYIATNRKLLTPAVNDSPRISPRPKPIFSSEPAKRRTTRDPKFLRNSVHYIKDPNESISFDYMKDTTRTKSILGDNNNSPSFSIMDPYEMMQISGAIVAKSFENPPSYSNNNSWELMKSTSTEVFNENIGAEVVQLLGNGDSGQAYKCRSKNGDYYVSKRYTNALHGNNDFARMIKEAAALSKLKHANIVSYIGSFVKNKHFFINIEFCNGFNLRKIINLYSNNDSVPSEHKVKIFLRQMLSALSYIHNIGIVHYDVKPDNIFSNIPDKNDLTEHNLVNINVFDPINNIFKLGDFGHCFISNIVNIGVKEGDSRYLAKEALETYCENYISNDGQTYPHSSSDIFALALTTAEYCGCDPLPKCGESWQLIREGHLPALHISYSDDLIDLLRKMIVFDNSDRPSATQCAECIYLKS